MTPTLLSIFAEIPDPRRGQGKMYPLAPILLFTVLAAGTRPKRGGSTWFEDNVADRRVAAGYMIMAVDAPSCLAKRAAHN